LLLIVLIPSWKLASSIVTTASKLSQSQFCTPKHTGGGGIDIAWGLMAIQQVNIVRGDKGNCFHH